MSEQSGGLETCYAGYATADSPEPIIEYLEKKSEQFCMATTWTVHRRKDGTFVGGSDRAMANYRRDDLVECVARWYTPSLRERKP